MSKTRVKMMVGLSQIGPDLCVELVIVWLGEPEFARAPRLGALRFARAPEASLGRPSSDFVLVLGLGRPALALVFASDPALRALELGQLDRLSSSLAALGLGLRPRVLAAELSLELAIRPRSK